jgi:alpha-D-ribose 1-methylphosphonate 5-triphosphate synthase subunit PhnG
MDVILHHYPVSITGTFEIRRTVTVHIPSQDARRQVHRWLLLEVSHMMGTEEPTLVVGDNTVWRVPVHLSTPQSGVVGKIGTVDVDAATGELLALATCKLQFEQRAQALMATVPSFQPKRLLHEMPSAYTVPAAP